MILHTASRATKNVKSDLSIEVVILNIDNDRFSKRGMSNPE